MSPIYVSAGDNKAFEPAPEGLWPVICVDVVDKLRLLCLQVQMAHGVGVLYVLTYSQMV